MHRLLSAAAVAVLFVAVAPAVASAGTGTPSAPETSGPSPVRGCTLKPSLTHPDGEQSSCIAVGAVLSNAPSVGHTAKLTVTVKAAVSEPDTHVTIDLSPNLAFADGTTTTAAFDGSGRVRRADAATMALTAGQSRSFSRTVKATAAGLASITATATDRVLPGRTDGGTDSVYLTVGAAASQFGHNRAASVSDAVAAVSGSATVGSRAAPAHVTPLPAGPKLATQRVGPDTPGTSCATGTWNYVDQASVTRPAHDVTVNILIGGSVVASGFTSPGDASYNVCWATGGVTTNIQVQWVESNAVWTLVNLSGTQYTFATGVTSIADGTTHDFGALQPGDSTVMRGLHAYDEGNDEYQWIYGLTSYIGGCWSPFETTCRQMVIHWQSDSTTGTFWNSSGAYLLAGSPDTLDEPVHEYGHGLMYNLYGQTFPATTNCSTHDLFVSSSVTCGWTEGWADWVATSVYNNMVWTYNGGFQRDMNVTWNEGLGYDSGDTTEARIVQAIRSLTDGLKGPWDNDPGEGSGIRDNTRWFDVLSDFRPNTFAQVWSGRASDGYDVSQTALGALYQGTIDYGFRNPLTSGVGVHFPEAVPPHSYSLGTSSGFWSLVAERPDSGTDTDLAVFSDFSQTQLVASSAFGGTTIDFVGLNTNAGHLAAGTYYPRVTEFSGTGGYSIVGQAGSHTLSFGMSALSLTAAQAGTILDSFQTSGVPVAARAVPTGSQEVQLAFLSADQNAVSRSSATVSSDPGVGQPTSMVYTPTATGWHGLVLLNVNGGSGTVNLYVDTTAPTGSVSIDGGAASTDKKTAHLTLSATDTQTGVLSMQVSTDGTFDTEPVVPYATAATATLTGADGTKTVYVRYLNNAGQWSTPVTDTISLSRIPVVSSLSPHSGSTAGGTTVTIKGTDFTGTNSVHFGTKKATSFTVVSSTKITAVAPAETAGAIHIRITNNYGQSGVYSAAKYTYVAPPVVTSIVPTSGSHNGGTSVTIHGTGFTGASKVRFGNIGATFTVVNDTKITATSPAHATGHADVTVTTAGGTSAEVTADRFTYT